MFSTKRKEIIIFLHAILCACVSCITSNPSPNLNHNAPVTQGVSAKNSPSLWIGDLDVTLTLPNCIVDPSAHCRSWEFLNFKHQRLCQPIRLLYANNPAQTVAGLISLADAATIAAPTSETPLVKRWCWRPVWMHGKTLHLWVNACLPPVLIYSNIALLQEWYCSYISIKPTTLNQSSFEKLICMRTYNIWVHIIINKSYNAT